MERPKFFIAMLVIETVLFVFTECADDTGIKFFKEYQNIKWKEILIRPEKYEEGAITVSGKVAYVENVNYFLYRAVIYQDRSDESSGFDPWGAMILRRAGIPRIYEGEILRVYGIFRGIDEETALPLIQTHYYEKLN